MPATTLRLTQVQADEAYYLFTPDGADTEGSPVPGVVLDRLARRLTVDPAARRAAVAEVDHAISVCEDNLKDLGPAGGDPHIRHERALNTNRRRSLTALRRAIAGGVPVPTDGVPR
jgi:hypothetical protein